MLNRLPRTLLPRLLLLGALWGAAFMFLRVAAPEFGVFALAGARVGLAGVLMLAIVLATARTLHWRARWMRYVLVGGVNTALPFLLYGFAALHIPAGYSAIANATVPVWSALIAWRLYHQQLGASVWLGIAVAFVGVYVLVGLQPVAVTALSVLGMVAALAGAALYAVSGYLISRHFAGGDGVAGATGMVLGAFVWLALPALIGAPPTRPSANAWAAVALLAIFCTAIGYILFFGLIRDYGPQRAATVAFLFPAFAALWGFLVLGEPITANMVLGMVMVFFGTTLISGIHRGLLSAFWRAWERVILPLVFVLSSSGLKRRILRAVMNSPRYFKAEAAGASAEIAQHLPAADLQRAIQEHRLTRFIDAADPLRSAWAESRTLEQSVVVRGAMLPPGPVLLLGAHHGSGWWILPWLRTRRGPVRFVAASIPSSADDTPWQERLWRRFLLWRWRELNRIGGKPVIPMRGALAQAATEFTQSGCVVALLDVPSRVTRKGSAVPFLGREAWLPRQLIDLAVSTGAHLAYLRGHFDPEAMRYDIAIEPFSAQSDPRVVFEEYAARLESDIRAAPGRWHSWGEIDLFFIPPEAEST
ncbi:MAG: EamA family transporter [Casimicrobiaceae bacterium]